MGPDHSAKHNEKDDRRDPNRDEREDAKFRECATPGLSPLLDHPLRMPGPAPARRVPSAVLAFVDVNGVGP